MRIGFITYEFPPDIAMGGIATYVEQASKLLAIRGQDVEVFCGSTIRDISENINGVLIHRVKSLSAAEFSINCVDKFSSRHEAKPFDIIESPEINANGLYIKQKYPKLPMVVKLHTPGFLQMRLYNFYTSKLSKLRFYIGALRRGRIRKFGYYEHKLDLDYKITRLADAVVSPSKSLRKILIKEWELEGDSIAVIPYPFIPPTDLLNLPVKNQPGKVVSFIGKLNVHKGIVNLVKVIPIVVRKHPDVIFRLIGNDSFFSVKKMNMSAFIKNELAGYEKNYIIEGGIPYTEIMQQIGTSSVCIFPSIWENFPLVCLESMSAGRAVIGSSEGGMQEMLSNGAGEIIDPLNIEQMANAVIKLLDNESLRHRCGNAAREKVLTAYNGEIVGKAMEDHFADVIRRCKLKET